jgi:hypothetical protein
MAMEASTSQIGEEEGEAVGFRVQPDLIHGARLEVSVRSQGKLLGEESSSIVTYWYVVRPDGTLYGEGHGIGMLKDGSTGTFTASGIGSQKTVGGPSHWRATLFYVTTSGKMSKLAHRPIFVEFDVDEHWKSKARIFEWK